jgi:nicotinamide-nucleotide amidase
MPAGDDTYKAAEALLVFCRERGLLLATAESSTGGLVAGALTDVPGSSDVVDRGFVVYSNEAKRELLGVPAQLIEAHGAVSEPVVRAMAEGALSRSRADITVGVTGVAGPGGGSVEKPAGLMHFAASRRGFATLHVERRFGDIGRAEVRRRSVLEALDLLKRMAQLSQAR